MPLTERDIKKADKAKKKAEQEAVKKEKEALFQKSLIEEFNVKQGKAQAQADPIQKLKEWL